MKPNKPNTSFVFKLERLRFVLLTANLRKKDEERMAENATQYAGGESFHAWNRASDTSDEAFHAGNDPFDTWNTTIHASDTSSYAWNKASEA